MLKEFGFDYGLKPRIILVSDMSFSEYFQKAKCLGMVYVHCPDSLGNMIVTEVGFNFEIEEYAIKFFDNLMRWVKESDDDGDAVNLEFIEKKNGEYLIAIAPNIEKFIVRMIGSIMQERVDPLFTMVTQGKDGMRISENYEVFKNQYVEGRRIPVRYFIGKNGEVEKIGEQYFVKTEFKFGTENQLPHDSLGHGLLAKKDKPFNPENLKRKRKPDLTIIEDRRMKELHYFYPLTLDKIENENWLSDLIKGIPPHISRSQVIQAICNIILMERLKMSNPDNIDINKPGYDLNILQHLLRTVESFDSFFPSCEFFTKHLIKKQAKLDKDYLNNYLQKI